MKRALPFVAAAALAVPLFSAAQEPVPQRAVEGKPDTTLVVPAPSALTQKRPAAAAGAATTQTKNEEPKTTNDTPEPPRIVPISSFSVPEGLEITVWATTPMLYNPTNIDFDKDGRLYIAEGVNYRSHAGRRKEGDRIVVLEDSDGDGKADKSRTFVQEEGLIAPLGVAVFDNKVVVSQPPDLIVYTDVDRNGVFDPAKDKREVLLTGFNGRNHDHSLHSVTGGPDGQWYFNQGNTGALFKDKSGKTFRCGSPYVHPNGQQVVDPSTIAGQKSDDGYVWIGGFSARMNPDGSSVAIIGHNYRNSYEQTVTSFGDLFQSDNDDPPACRVTAVLEGGNAGFASRDGKRTWAADQRPGQPKPIAEWRQEDPGTMPAGDIYGGGSPTGVAFYENGALGDRWRGLLLACEAGRNVIFGYLPKPDGAGFQLDRFDFVTSNKEKQFAGSDFLGGTTSVTHELKTLFRPSDVCVGPDGALYIADWFDPRVGGHADLDPATSGTIYRVAPKGFKSVVPKLDLATTEGQLAALQSPAANVRHSGFHALKAKGEPAVPGVAALLKDGNPYVASRAIWLLAQMGPSGAAQVQPLLDSAKEQERLVAYRALRRAGQDPLALAKKMAADASPAVRREVALTMRDVPFAESRDILIEVARRFNGRDRSYLEAFGLGCEGKERDVYHAIVKAAGAPAEQWQEAMSWIAWRLSSPDAVDDLRARAFSEKLSFPERKLMVDALAFIKSPYAALAMVDLASTPDFPLKSHAFWWLLNRQSNFWEGYGLPDALKERFLYDPEKVVLTSITSPPPPTEPTKLQLPEILQLTGDPKRGEVAVAACYTCHKIGAQGIDFGPELTMFGKTQTREVVLNAIVNPSSEIAHGYDGSRIVTKDNLTIDGIVLTREDPVLIKSMGGQIQTVPRARIKRLSKLGHSLMFSAEMLGLPPQTIADIAAYLQSDLLQ
jgi:putative membrane-bound dehydrogenase-like protein